MAQRKYDSFAVGILNDGNAAVHIDLSINVWADVRHSSEIDFGIQIPHKDDISGFSSSFLSRLKRTMLLTLLPRFVITDSFRFYLIRIVKLNAVLTERLLRMTVVIHY